MMTRQSRERSAAANLNGDQVDELARKYPWLSSVEIREMLAEAAEEYGAEENAGARRPEPRT